MGSQTTPPCNENTYHLIFTKTLIISGCQFKLLRENSLISYKPKNIHARKEQPLSERILYIYNSSKIRYINDITSTLPLEYNKNSLYSSGNKEENNIKCNSNECNYIKKEKEDERKKISRDFPDEIKGSDEKIN
jgi:hypothetical protein